MRGDCIGGGDEARTSHRSWLALAVAATAAILSGSVLVGCGVGATGEPADPSETASAVIHDPADPATWTDRELAARLLFAGANVNQFADVPKWVREGVRGLVLLGTPDDTFATQIKNVRAIAPDLLIASDEEGGGVQILRSVLGPLPSAATTARTMSPTAAGELAFNYATKMKAAGVNVSLGPVADINVPGGYIGAAGRAFSTDPTVVGSYVVAWDEGVEKAGVMPVVKHWPGHGAAANTHTGSGKTPPWEVLQARDQLPFTEAIAAGVPAVMVGHLLVPGLGEAGVPTSQSSAAFRTLRELTGPDVLIMTDSLSMAAVGSQIGQNSRDASVRAIVAGADVALVNSGKPMKIIKEVAAAIRSGDIPREQAVTSARRVLAAQQRWN